MNPRLSAALASVIWGSSSSSSSSSSYIFITSMVPEHPVFTAAVRALGGGLPLLALYPRLPHRAWWGKVILLGTLNCGVFFAFLLVAAERLPGGIAGTLQSLGPIFTILIVWPLLCESPSPMRLASVVLGAIGVMLLLASGKLALDATGAAAGIGAALSFALSGVLLNRWGRPAPLLVFTAWQLVVGGIELALFAMLTGDLPTTITATNLLGLAYLGLIGTAVAYALWFHAIEKVGGLGGGAILLVDPDRRLRARRGNPRPGSDHDPGAGRRGRARKPLDRTTSSQAADGAAPSPFQSLKLMRSWSKQ
jgi:probable blue pigment (indigoidine) exporter